MPHLTPTQHTLLYTDPIDLYNEAWTSVYNGLLEEAKAPLNQALKAFTQQDATLRVVECLVLRGILSYHQGETHGCIKNHEFAKAYLLGQKDVPMDIHAALVSSNCHNLSLGLRAHGCHSQALRTILEAVELRKDFHSHLERRKLVESLSLQAEEILYTKKDIREAMQKIDEAFHIVEPEDKNFECYASLLHAKGIICLAKGCHLKALETFGKAVGVYDKCVPHGGSVDYAECLAYYGHSLALLDRGKEALERLEKATLMASSKAPNSIALATVIRIDGDARRELCDFHQAELNFEKVLSIHKVADSCKGSVDKAKASEGLLVVKDLRRQNRSSSHASEGALASSSKPVESQVHHRDYPSWLDTLRDWGIWTGLSFGTFLTLLMAALVVTSCGGCFLLSDALLRRKQRERIPVFVSHTGKCKTSATFGAELSKTLSDSKIPNFYDEDSLGAGNLFPTEIHHQVYGCKVFVCVWCEKFTDCEWCMKELDWALETGCTIIPVMLDKETDKPSNDRFAKKIRDKFGEKYSDGDLDRWCENLLVLDKIGQVKNEWTGKKKYIKLRESVVRAIHDTTANKSACKSYRSEFRAFGRK